MTFTPCENAPGQGGALKATSTTPKFSYPRCNSVKAAVLADLLGGEALTHMDVWERHGSSRAAHHILMLRKAGWDVETHEIDVPTSDGRTASIAKYSLPPDTIRAAGLAGEEFVAEVRSARGGAR